MTMRLFITWPEHLHFLLLPTLNPIPCIHPGLITVHSHLPCSSAPLLALYLLSLTTLQDSRISAMKFQSRGDSSFSLLISCTCYTHVFTSLTSLPDGAFLKGNNSISFIFIFSVSQARCRNLINVHWVNGCWNKRMFWILLYINRLW